MPFENPLNSLTIPEGEGSGTPRIVCGSEIPAGLVAYYDTASDLRIKAAIISYSAITNVFEYRGILGDAGASVVEGYMRTSGGGTVTVSEMVRYGLAGSDHVQAWY